MNPKYKKVLSIFLPLILGGLVSFIIQDKIDYLRLIRPPFAPPKALFPLAWSIIYFLMGLSYYLLNKKVKISEAQKKTYYFQLFVNLLWSILFFFFKFRFIACIWIILLDIFVLRMITLFYKSNKTSAYLNIPYLLWILFATYLTIGIYILN